MRQLSWLCAGLLLCLPLVMGEAWAQVPSGGGIPYPVINGECLIGSNGQPVWGSCSGSGTSVSSVTGTSGQITASPTTGNVVLTLPSTITESLTFSGSNAYGTPASMTATNVTGLPLTTGITGTLLVGHGGTGLTTWTAAAIPLGNGTSAPNFLSEVDGDCVVGSAGAWTAGSCGGGSSTITANSTATSGFSANQYLYSDGSLIQAGSFGTNVATWLATPSGANLAAALTTALPVSKGGTGLTTWTSAAIPLGNGTSAPNFLSEVDGDCVLGSGGAWTAGSCGGTGGSGVGVAGGESVATINNASGTLAAGHYIVQTVTAAFTAARTTTLPTAAAFGAHIIHFYDNYIATIGCAINGANTWNIKPNGTDTINGVTGTSGEVILNVPCSGLDLFSDGVSNWTPLGNFPAGTSGGIPYYSAVGQIASSALLTQYGIIYGGGAGGSPVATAAMTNGQLLVGQTSAAPLPKTISGDVTFAASGAATVGSIGGTAIALGTLTNGDLCTYASSGTLIKCNTTALPNGTTATTQTVGDNTTKVATDAFVLANVGGGGITCPTGFTASGADCIWTIAASGSQTTLQWTGLTGDNYNLKCTGIGTATSSTVYIQFGEGGTPTWGTGSNYVRTGMYSNSSSVINLSSTGTGFANVNGLTSGDQLVSLEYNFHGLSETGYYKTALGTAYQYDGSLNYAIFENDFYNADTNAITAIRLMNSGPYNFNTTTICTLYYHAS